MKKLIWMRNLFLLEIAVDYRGIILKIFLGTYLHQFYSNLLHNMNRN